MMIFKLLSFEKIIFSFTFSFLSFIAFGQLNVNLVGQLSYDSLRTNDVWGYVAPDGTEYALVGLRTGISIVSLSDASNPSEVARIDGATSTWRDLKTWGNYAFVTTDVGDGDDGLTVIDLSELPNDANYFNWKPVFGEDTLKTCHNLFIDEKGWCYLSGCNVNEGGIIFLDVFSEPGNPLFEGFGSPTYSHDVYARNDKMYTSEIGEGHFGVYDVSDKANPILLALQKTPFNFTHNTWLSDDEKYLFTTDEKANASTAAYDISDLSDIQLLDEFRPQKTIGRGVIPHNVHVKEEFLVISHYTDGLVIVDATFPDNLIEVGNYDTHMQHNNKFHGAWGAYPFLPSGLTLVSDIESGLFVLQPNYNNACWLEGKVTDAQTGAPIIGADLKIQSDEKNGAFTGFSGDYATGHGLSGNFEIKVTEPRYFDAVVEVELKNGEVTILNIEMEPLPVYSINGNVIEKGSGNPIENAIILIENENLSFTTNTDIEGNFELPVVTGEYTVYVGAWGWENLGFENQNIDQVESQQYELERFYQDNFNIDFGWKVSGDATSGHWERGIPTGTKHEGFPVNPGNDVEEDFDGNCYVTGVLSTSKFDKDVDNGTTILTSPVFKISNYNRPILSFHLWFFGGASPTGDLPNDTLKVFLSNGLETILIESLSESTGDWVFYSFDLAKLLEITDEMQLILEVADDVEFGHSVEAGIDLFEVKEGLNNSDFEVIDDLAKFRVYPNPFYNNLFIDYKVEEGYIKLDALIFNALGQKVEEIQLQNTHGTIQFDAEIVPSTYFLVFRIDNEITKAIKLIKGR